MNSTPSYGSWAGHILEQLAPLLSSQNLTLPLYKNGLHYLTDDRGPVFAYEDLFQKEGGREVLTLYLEYRLAQQMSSSDEKLKAGVAQAVQRIVDGVEKFHRGQRQLENYDDTEEWLFLPTYSLLTQGGDQRNVIAYPHYKNKYNTGPLPQYDIQRSSCTSSSISREGYVYIESLHFSLIADHLQGQLLPDEIFSSLRAEIRHQFAPAITQSGTPGLYITPSGTDVEYLCTMIGLARSRELYPSSSPHQVLVIVNAHPEVGSGTLPAANLAYFDPITPKGQEIDLPRRMDLPGEISVEAVSFPARNPDGSVIPGQDLEDRIFEKIDRALSEKKVVVFHYVHASKTGVSIPSLSMAKKVKKEYGSQVVVIVDGAQLRLTTEAIEEYLGYSFNVIITGSKFISAPPFSGGLLVCEQDHRTMFTTDIPYPPELDQFLDRYSFPPEVIHSPKYKWINWGLYLRWQVALFEWKRYGQLPVEFRDQLVSNWRDQVVDLLKSQPGFQVLDESGPNHMPPDESSLSESNSVVSFEVSSEKDFTKDELREIHRYMSRDLSNQGGSAVRCEIGQPVRSNSGDDKRFALRLALGAKNLYEAYHRSPGETLDEAVKYLVDEDRKLIEKLCYILDTNH